MAKSLSDILKEADESIEKRASKKIEKTASADDVEIEKLAAFLNAQSLEKVAGITEPIETEIEKTAHAVALMETALALEDNKIAEFIKTAKDNGHGDEEISIYLNEKIATEIPLHKYVIPALIGGTALGVGSAVGKKRGYNKAVKDIESAINANQAQ